MALSLGERIVVKSRNDFPKFTRVRYELWCDCGCGFIAIMEVFHKKGKKEFTDEQLRSKLLAKHNED
jgi:hypothetical protein